MILCVTPNPAIDRTLLLPGLAPGEVHRATQTIVAAGGKGLNVARAIKLLGGEHLCMGFVGGHTGKWLAELAQTEGLNTHWTWTDVETRTCTILVAGDGDATVVNEPGMPITIPDWEGLQLDVEKQLPSFDRVCISGSLPPESSVRNFKALLSLLVEAGKQVWVDTSGVALQTALDHPGICIKANADEMGEALDLEVQTANSAQRALELLIERGVSAVVVTRGADGALLATRDERWQAFAPPVNVVSTVGSGDAFLGGFINALDSGGSWAEALREGMAAGTANALSAGGGQFPYQAFDELRARIQIEAW